MSQTKFIMDSAGDLPREYISKHDISIIGYDFSINDTNYYYSTESDGDSCPTIKEFYELMRAGGAPKTTLIAPQRYMEFFEPELVAGRDVFHVTISSGLSGTYCNAALAARKLEEKYPGRRVRVIDSLSATGGEGIVMRMIMEKHQEGLLGDALEEYINANKLRVHHRFTVNDLVYLKRGGRISSATALIGGILNIKPVLCINDEGKLISNEKAQGRRRALKRLAYLMERDVPPGYAGPLYIAHADCEDDAKLLNKMVSRALGRDADAIIPLSPLVGAHTGPGMASLFYVMDKPGRK
jgi:DegV family protein with EDD domain